MSSGGTEVRGNQVNFSYYTAHDVGNVYVAGTMNGWSTDSDRMQISSNYKTYTYSMTLEPGEYEYKFYREIDGKYYRDPYNPFMYQYDNSYNSILYIPGIITTSLTIEKDDLIELPTELEYLKPNGGRVTKAVTYTSGTAGVTINGNSVTLADDFTADEFTVTATTADSESRLVNVSLYTRNTVAETGRVHIEYVDEDGNVLASDSITGAIGASYTTTAIAIDGYTVKTIPANASGTHTSADIFITYVYSKVEDNTGDNNSNPDSSPVTGDESHTYIWLLVMIMGALGIVMTRNKYFDTRD